jgi:hypothetical protein
MVGSFELFGFREKTAAVNSQGRSYFTNQNQLLHENLFSKLDQLEGKDCQRNYK